MHRRVLRRLVSLVAVVRILVRGVILLSRASKVIIVAEPAVGLRAFAVATCGVVGLGRHGLIPTVGTREVTLL